VDLFYNAPEPTRGDPQWHIHGRGVRGMHRPPAYSRLCLAKTVTTRSDFRLEIHRERQYTDTLGLLAKCRFPGLAISNAKIAIYIFQIKYTEAISSNSTRKLLWFEITELLIAD